MRRFSSAAWRFQFRCSHITALPRTTRRKSLTVKATVTEWFWANPHCFLKFDAKDDKGNVVHWATETSNPSDMVNLGWSKHSFKPGDEVTVTFTPVKNGAPVGRIDQVVLANGQILKARVVFKSADPTPVKLNRSMRSKLRKELRNVQVLLGLDHCAGSQR